ncbi:MAG: hypothetical protein HYV17_02880 [Xanthomonadales bacterium]|nr:hypothetical protein [Xanthomonadales bacterium]
MEFNLDLDVTPRPPVDPNATLFATVPGHAADLGNGECVLRTQHDDVPHVMTYQVLAALDRCREFRSAEEHIEAIRQNTPGAPVDGIRRVFNGLVQRGLIVAAEDFVAPFLAPAAPPRAEAGGLYLRAGERPERLQRLLDSLRQQVLRGFEAPMLTVIDEARSADAIAAHAAMLRAHRELGPAPVRHVDAGAWQRVHDALAAALPEQRAVLDDLIGRRRDGIAPGGTGPGWNLALLLGAGRRILFGDDDLVLPLKLHPELRDGIELEARATLPVRFYGGAESALQAGHDAEFDLLQWHLDLCGAPIGQVFDHASRLVPTREQWRRLAPSRMPQLQPQARVLATLNGRRGHSGHASADWMYQLDAASSRDLYQERNRYLRLLESGSVWIGPDRACAMQATPMLPFAQDLSQLPAFVVAGGGDAESSYAAISRVLTPHAWFLQLPTSAAHPPEAGQRLAAPGSSEVTRSFNQFLGDFLERCEGEIFGGTAQARLAAAAARIEDLAAATDHDLLRLLGEYLLASFGGRIQRLQAVAAAAGSNAPVYWSADLQAVVKAHAKALLQDGPPRLGGWPAGLDAAGCAARLRGDLQRAAAAMRAWPQLWQAARALGDRLV